MIGLLNAYQFEKEAPAYQAEYGTIFQEFLRKTFPERKIKVYQAALGELPADVNECEAWVITGSPKGAYETEPWIVALGNFVKSCHAQEKKLIGVCFGHQLIAHYLGGLTEKSPRGWGAGVRSFRVFQSPTWMKPELKQCSLLFSHQDQVVKLPEGAVLLAEDEFCPNQMYTIGEHILCMQGHPEFTPQFVRGRLDARKHIVGQETYDRAVESLSQKTNVAEVIEWIRRFVSQ